MSSKVYRRVRSGAEHPAGLDERTVTRGHRCSIAQSIFIAPQIPSDLSVHLIVRF